MSHSPPSNSVWNVVWKLVRTASKVCVNRSLAVRLISRIALSLTSAEVDVVGVSTVGGNAPRGIVDLTTAALLEQFGLGALVKRDVRAALEQGPLTILALGPLTNIAALLHEEPELRKNVARLIAVMGRRPGHIFHPAEGADGGRLFGHGPVFRDFNFALDPDAVSRVLALNVPISFVPYDAARGIGTHQARRPESRS